MSLPRKHGRFTLPNNHDCLLSTASWPMSWLKACKGACGCSEGVASPGGCQLIKQCLHSPASMVASMRSLLQATPLLDKYIFSTFKSAFGGRVRFIVSGGAPLSTHVEEYLAVTLCTPVFQASHPAKLFPHP